jgi:hypothetical protein
VIGYRLFEFLLGDVSGASLVDRIRAELGLLVAAGLVAGYHFGLWRHERTLLGAASPAKARSIGHVTLVTGSHPEPLAQAIADATGARVSVWRRADGGAEPPPAGDTTPGQEELVHQVTAALAGVLAAHVLLVVGPDSGAGTRLEVIPLETGGTAR